MSWSEGRGREGGMGREREAREKIVCGIDEWVDEKRVGWVEVMTRNDGEEENGGGKRKKKKEVEKGGEKSTRHR